MRCYEYISRDAGNDDHRHFEFVRNTRLPLGTFPRGQPLNLETVVFAVCAVGALLVIVLTGAL